MRALLLLLAILLTLSLANAQSPAPELDTLKEVKQTDPEAKNIPQDPNYIKDHIKITSKEIPAALKQTLESSPQYQGWEKAQIYKNKVGNKYTVEITKADTARTYHFDRAGIPVKE